MPGPIHARTHKVKANMQVLELNNAGSSLELEIFEGGSKIGRMIVGRGSITWYGKGRQKGKRMNWRRFARLMNEHIYGEPGWPDDEEV